MIVLLLLFGSVLLFRGLGALGISVFGSWIASTCLALAVGFLFTSCAHFSKLRWDLARRMPRIFPNPIGWVYSTWNLRNPGRRWNCGATNAHSRQIRSVCFSSDHRACQRQGRHRRCPHRRQVGHAPFVPDSHANAFPCVTLLGHGALAPVAINAAPCGRISKLCAPCGGRS